MIHIFHKWKITKRGHRDDEFAGAIRKCVKCGKREKLNVHCLGLNPPAYVRDWCEIKRGGK